MPVAPSDFLVSALAFSDHDNEMMVRNRVSRAYYGGYLTARDIQEKSGVRIPKDFKGGVHARLIHFYEKGLLPDMPLADQVKMAGLLRLSKTLRTKADYQLSIRVPPSDGETSIRCANEICRLFEK
jgi:hypothetical protein